MPFVIFLTACAGSGRLEFASLDYRTIEPPPARSEAMNVDQCYWWTDENGQVWIALQREVTSWLLGPLGRFHLQMSLAFEKLPAGKARNYTIDPRTLRARLEYGPREGRFVSLSGIATLSRQSSDQLKGSFRLTATQEVNRLLGGWSQPTRYLILGAFEAVHDEKRGRAIRDATESSGWERMPRPASQPVEFTAANGDWSP